MNISAKAFICALVALSLSCGDPVGPATSAWQTLASFGEGRCQVTAIGVEGDAVFFAFQWNEAPTPSIKYYRNGTVTNVFRVDLKTAYWASIEDIAIKEGSGWAVGSRAFEVENSDGWRFEPFLIQYNGRVWREVQLDGAIPAGKFRRVVPINYDSFWFLFDEGTYGDFEPTTLWKYERGGLVEYPRVKAEAVVYDADTGTTFALALKNGVQVLISPDEGVTWFEEKVKFENPWSNYEPDRISACTANGILYVATTDSNGDPIASTVYRRFGAPGAGEYELLLYCPVGPNFGEIESVAVDDRGRILAVGKWTSAFYDGLSWAQESLPQKNHFYDINVGAKGFYAAANDENWNLEILYHP